MEKFSGFSFGDVIAVKSIIEQARAKKTAFHSPSTTKSNEGGKVPKKEVEIVDEEAAVDVPTAEVQVQEATHLPGPDEDLEIFLARALASATPSKEKSVPKKTTPTSRTKSPPKLLPPRSEFLTVTSPDGKRSGGEIELKRQGQYGLRKLVTKQNYRSLFMDENIFEKHQSPMQTPLTSWETKKSPIKTGPKVELKRLPPVVPSPRPVVAVPPDLNDAFQMLPTLILEKYRRFLSLSKRQFQDKHLKNAIGPALDLQEAKEALGTTVLAPHLRRVTAEGEDNGEEEEADEALDQVSASASPELFPEASSSKTEVAKTQAAQKANRCRKNKKTVVPPAVAREKRDRDAPRKSCPCCIARGRCAPVPRPRSAASAECAPTPAGPVQITGFCPGCQNDRELVTCPSSDSLRLCEECCTPFDSWLEQPWKYTSYRCDGGNCSGGPTPSCVPCWFWNCVTLVKESVRNGSQKDEEKEKDDAEPLAKKRKLDGGEDAPRVRYVCRRSLPGLPLNGDLFSLTPLPDSEKRRISQAEMERYKDEVPVRLRLKPKSKSAGSRKSKISSRLNGVKASGYCFERVAPIGGSCWRRRLGYEAAKDSRLSESARSRPCTPVLVQTSTESVPDRGTPDGVQLQPHSSSQKMSGKKRSKTPSTVFPLNPMTESFAQISTQTIEMRRNPQSEKEKKRAASAPGDAARIPNPKGDCQPRFSALKEVIPRVPVLLKEPELSSLDHLRPPSSGLPSVSASKETAASKAKEDFRATLRQEFLSCGVSESLLNRHPFLLESRPLILVERVRQPALESPENMDSSEGDCVMENGAEEATIDGLELILARESVPSEDPNDSTEHPTSGEEDAMEREGFTRRLSLLQLALSDNESGGVRLESEPATKPTFSPNGVFTGES